MTLHEVIEVLRHANGAEEIDVFRNQIVELIPQVKIMIGFDQKSYAHQYDLWFHSLWTVANLPKDIDDDMVYLGALLHDIGKPECQTEGEHDGKPTMRYRGHQERSLAFVRDEILPELNLDEDDRRRLLYYVGYHDDTVSLRIKHLRRHLKLGASLEEFQNLMKLEVADAKAHIMLPLIEQRIEICGKLSGEYAVKLYNDILAGK